MIRAAFLAIALLAPTPLLAATVTTPGPVTLAPLDVSVVTTGGTAVTAIVAGGRTAGGWIALPASASAPLCISELATATTISSGTTTCITAGQSYVVAPGNGPVSANSTAAGLAFSGLAMRQ